MARGKRQTKIKTNKERRKEEPIGKTADARSKLIPESAEGRGVATVYRSSSSDCDSDNDTNSRNDVLPLPPPSPNEEQIDISTDFRIPTDAHHQLVFLKRMTDAMYAKGLSEEQRLVFFSKLRFILKNLGVNKRFIDDTFPKCGLETLESPTSSEDSGSNKNEEESDDSDLDISSEYEFVNGVEEDEEQENGVEENGNDGEDYDPQQSEEVNPYTPRLPCQDCRINNCANCLSDFKSGDIKCNRIPSSYQVVNSGHWVSLEVALTCVFDPASPYLKWSRAKEMSAASKMQDCRMKTEILTEADFAALSFDCEKETSTKSDSSSVVTKDCKNNPKTPESGRSEEKKPLDTLEDIDAMSSISFNQTSKSLAQKVVESEHYPLPDLYLCVGCAELLTVLFTAWERLEAKKMPVQLYFFTVMMGFNKAKHAQHALYRPPRGSKLFTLKQSSSKCHPKGCQVRTNRRGVRVELKSNEDVLKNSVGNLHAFIHEIYCRVYNEILKEILDDYDGDSTTVFWG